MKFPIFVELKGKESLRKKKKKKNRRLESNESGVKSGEGANTPEALTCGPPVVGNSSTPTSAQWSF